MRKLSQKETSKEVGEISLRDVMFLCHPKPNGIEQTELFRKIANNELSTPDTWEVSLSAGKDKLETWVRLLKENRLGYMALLKNLRNMNNAGVPCELVVEALQKGAVKALPFRFVAAARHAPNYVSELNDAMLKAVEGQKVLNGKTVILVDVSGSMDCKLSSKSDLMRLDAASALAVLAREVVNGEVQVYTFSQETKQVSNYRGLPLIDAISKSQPHGGTYLAKSLKELREKNPAIERLVVITDEQTHDGTANGWGRYNYLINVGTEENALSTSGGWQRINGFSESVVRWMVENERLLDLEV